jgi:hypothetical protein
VGGVAGGFKLVILMPDPGTVADREVADAVAGSFLGRLPSDLVDALWRWASAPSIPSGSTIYRLGSYPRTP